MAERPRVGVTGSSRRWSPGWWCTALALRLAGATPCRLSVRQNQGGKRFAALVIGGGDDISPEHYDGELTAKVKADPARDSMEMEWIRWALDKDVPLLGICRGAQLINVVLGGTLHQDIRGLRKRTHNRPGVLPTKQVRLEAESRVARVCGKAHLKVNSLHHQAVKDPGAGLRVVGWDLDRITQAIECSTDRKVIGVQWHPEYLFYLPSHFALFRWLLKTTT